MRKFSIVASQGEVNFKIIGAMPEGLAPFDATGKHYIIGHSENGNHHVLERSDVDIFKGGKTSAGMQILYALVNVATSVKQTSTGTPHAPITFDAGDIVKIWPSVDFNPFTDAISLAQD